MCVKLPSENLNPSPCPPHSTSTYTCGVIIMLRVLGGKNSEREKITRKLNKKTRQLFLVY